MCTACSTSTELAFCPSPTGSQCLAVQGCAAGCRTCTAPPAGMGDNCSSPVVINARGRARTVLTTCGLHDDLNLNCGVSGNDLVFALHPSSFGRYSLRVTTTPGVTVYLSSDGFSRSCSEESMFRRCITSGSGSSRTDAGGLTGGDLYFYVATSVPATVVIDTELP